MLALIVTATVIKRRIIMESKNVLVGIIMGSDSDLPVLKDAAKILEEFGIGFEITIVSAHRTPQRMFDYAKRAEERGLEVIIAGAGGAAHLPGMVAAITNLPVIGVPVKTSALNGLDSLLSIVQMPGGIPVATVAINNAKNAGILAAHILGIKYPEIRKKIADYKQAMKAEVEKKAEKLESMGYEDFLNSSK
jgi:5-(carboxyamino)imidazole ribonucleotide mutase